MARLHRLLKGILAGEERKAMGILRNWPGRGELREGKCKTHLYRYRLISRGHSRFHGNRLPSRIKNSISTLGRGVRPFDAFYAKERKRIASVFRVLESRKRISE